MPPEGPGSEMPLIQMTRQVEPVVRASYEIPPATLTGVVPTIVEDDDFDL